MAEVPALLCTLSSFVHTSAALGSVLHVYELRTSSAQSVGSSGLGTHLEAMKGVMSSSSGNETYVVIFRLSLAECSNRCRQRQEVFSLEKG